MKTRRIAAIFVLVLMTATVTVAKNHAKEIDKLLTMYREYGQLNGTVLVAEKSKVIYKKGHGMADMEWSIQNSPDTKFRIGSVTKQFTAALIMQLVEEGKIKLDAKMTEYLTEYRKDTGDKITIHQLLNHTSGIPSYTTGEFFREHSRDPYSVADFVKNFSSGDLEFEPGSKFAYNNSGYFLLGAVIEKVTGKSYAEVLQERIFKPLGMRNSGYDITGTILSKRASGYQKTPDGYENAAYLDMGLPYAAGSLYSTVDDLYLWDQALYGDRVLSAESKKKMFTPGLEGYGYGFFIEDREIAKTGKKTHVVQHGGGINGFNCLFTRLVDDKHLIVILDNVGLGRHHAQITNSIISILNNQSYELPKMSIAETLYKTYKSGGIEAAVKQYRDLKGEDAAKYDFSEGELNTLGYGLLNLKKNSDAIEIFKLNVEMFPEAANPYDSLGEAYLADNQKELSLLNYKRSLELNPDNEGARLAIAKLEGKEIMIDTSLFDAYVGEYELVPGFSITVTKDGEKLFAQATGQGQFELEPLSNELFSIPSVRAQVMFVKDEKGTVTGIELNQGGRKTPGKKVK